MSAQIIDGKSVAEQIVAECARAAGAFASPPGLAVILVGDNPASRVYVRNKERACARAGFYSEKIELPDSISESELLAVVAAKNADPKIHGILLQLPLPSQIDSARALAAISPRKDVDGFHAENIGLLAQNRPGLRPCTPAGCIELLRRAGTQIKGAHAVVVGRSDIVGKPMALLLLHESATVTICHSQTRDLTAFTRAADIVVAAIGRARFLTGEMIKPGATVLDVGINRLPDGSICGDVDFESAREVAGAITPVPGGVGPMTIATLLSNTLAAARAQSGG